MYLWQPLQYFLLKSIPIGKIWHTCKFNGHFIEVRIPMTNFFGIFDDMCQQRYIFTYDFWCSGKLLDTLNEQWIFFFTFDVSKFNAKTLFQLNNDEWSNDKSNETREIFWTTRKIKH